MSFLAAFHAHRPIRLGTPTVRTFLRCAMVRRIAAGALDSPVLQVLGVDSDARTKVNRTMVRPRAHWRTVMKGDGRKRLEADWRVEP